MIDKIIIILGLILFTIMFYGLIQNWKQFYNIMALKENRKYKSFFYENSVNGRNYVFTNDWVKDYMPISIIWKLLDEMEFINLDEVLKPLYLVKYKYEKMFYFGFLGNILIALIMMITGKDTAKWKW